MKKLKDILEKVSVISITHGVDVVINKIHFDSRNIGQNDVFVAQKGTLLDGHNYITKAINSGASVIVCEDVPAELNQEVTYVKVHNASKALAVMSANFYGNPSEKIKLVGITGTNGKTTVATLLYQLFKKAGYKVGLLSTVKIMVDETQYETKNTTPDSLSINRYLNEMVLTGVEYCFMEVSSHGIHQNRTLGLAFDGGVFTNLTHDHLDYHSTFKEYLHVKKEFFDSLSKTAFALTNIDDKNGNVMLQNCIAQKYTYGLKNIADYKCKIIEKQFSGTLLQINNVEVWTKLIGKFNAYNVSAIYGVAVLLGLPEMEVLRLLSILESVSGRFQYTVSNNGIIGIVDYAHTPDALENVLGTINDIRTGNENVITVVGCGGDRDITKRPIMARIASELSNHTIFTSDNPRTEDAQQIIEAMEQGVEPHNFSKTLSIVNRKQAIKTACKLAKSKDIILVAGKGHETYQEVNGERSYFNDYEEILNCFNQL